MGLMHRVLLLATFALLCMHAKAAGFDHDKVPRTVERGGGARQLRTATMSDDEARVSKLPSFIESFVKNRKIESWIQNKVTDDFVLSELKLVRLPGTSLADDPNFKLFQKFKIGGWLEEKATTTKAWENLGLDSLPFDQVSKTDEFKTYTQYVTALNKKASKLDIDQWHGLLSGGSPEELMAKAMILRTLGRDVLERRVMLGGHVVVPF
uniref:Secreted RxLR effector Avr1 n=1 Tax=Phytophthora infestans TaxID=4787 RepID=A0A3G3BKE2_PHYIN|nr:secreted RxLR effector Avr1 [Phytophthora infestans]AYP64691.1 secreted RxLR effector Avr1 [Phytophthora infestans]AYP64692.1 secreted RxLR effector Avr1 [Phytophthora infestans]